MVSKQDEINTHGVDEQLVTKDTQDDETNESETYLRENEDGSGKNDSDIEENDKAGTCDGEQTQKPRTVYKNYCYILINDCDHKTYNGYTNNPLRRLRQHNNELKGGAKFTTRRRKRDGIIPRRWEFLAIIESPGMSRTKALSLEWHLHYPTCRKPRPKIFNGANGRLNSIPHAIGHAKFSNMSFVIRVTSKYYERACKVLLNNDNTAIWSAHGAQIKITSFCGTDDELCPAPDQCLYDK